MDYQNLSIEQESFSAYLKNSLLIVINYLLMIDQQILKFPQDIGKECRQFPFENKEGIR